MALIAACFCAADDMDERASQLISALNFPTNDDVFVENRPIFAGTDTVKSGNFQVKKKRVMNVDSVSITDVEILDRMDHAMATGQIIEGTSSNSVRVALAKKLVMNSMPLELLLQIFELRADEAGEFCIVRKRPDKATGELIKDPSVIHFVRGSKAVSLYSSKGEDIRNMAKALDGMLFGK